MKIPRSPTKIRLHSWLWLVITFVLLLLQLFYPHRAWMTLLILMGGACLFAYLWARSLGRGISLQREMRYGWAQVGDHLEERFTVSNTGLAPGLWVEVEDHSTLPDYSISRVTAVGSQDSTQWKVEQVCTRRGLFTLGPTSLHTTDPFNLFQVDTELPDSTALLVLPPILPLPAIQIAPGGQVGDGRRHRRSALETTVSVDTVREYAPGDPIKSIHWPTSVRRESLYVRQFEHTPSSDWWIFLDLEKVSQVGEGKDSTEEHGVILASSLADRGLRQGNAVGLVTCGKELVWIPPQHNSSQLMEILRTLAVVKSGDRPLSELLTNAQYSLQRGASLILITPNLKGDWAAPLLRLARMGITPTVFLFDPVSFGGQGSAPGMTSQLENYGITSNMISRALLDHFEAPGNQGKWEWKVVGRGKAVPVKKPVQTTWRRLG